jgi:hypothetical protein
LTICGAPTRSRQLLNLVAACVRPLRLGREIREAWHTHAPEVAEITGRGKARQLVDLIRLVAFQYGWPWSYYKYGIYRPELRKRAREMIHQEEVNTLLGYLNRLTAPDDARAIHHKDLFYDHCRSHGLSTPKTSSGWVSAIGSSPGIFGRLENRLRRRAALELRRLADRFWR